MTEQEQGTGNLKSVAAIAVAGAAIGAAVLISPLIPLIAMIGGAVTVGIAESRARRD